jgi:hypothetical protein
LSTTLRDEMRVAAKDYRCDCCRQPIPKGTRYAYAFVADGYDSGAWRTHNATGHCGKTIDDDGDRTYCEMCE